MTNLKELTVGEGGAFLEDLFLIDLLEPFPNLQKMTIKLQSSEKVVWKEENITSVFENLVKLRSLKISNLKVSLVNEYDEVSTIDPEARRDDISNIFKDLIEIIQKKFNDDINDFEIHDEEYGFVISKEKFKSAKLNNNHKVNGKAVKNVIHCNKEEKIILKLEDQDDITMSMGLVKKISDFYNLYVHANT